MPPIQDNEPGTESAPAVEQTLVGPGDLSPRPTRAELRRVREAEALGAASRVERRRLEARREAEHRARTSPLRAWWFYLLLLAIAACVYLAVAGSASEPAPPAPVVTTAPPPDLS